MATLPKNDCSMRAIITMADGTCRRDQYIGKPNLMRREPLDDQFCQVRLRIEKRRTVDAAIVYLQGVVTFGEFVERSAVCTGGVVVMAGNDEHRMCPVT